jgi:hypothetical protein
MIALLWLAAAFAQELPPCLTRDADELTRDAVPADIDDAEVLARLVIAEATSTGFPDDPLVHLALAWGVTNRVRLAEISASAARSYGRGVRGVVFQPSQFNPAVSTRSPFAAVFLCPTDAHRWALASSAARVALAGEGNPFLATPWEVTHGRSLVVNFYYPQSIQARGPLAPWESSTQLRFLGDVPLPGGVLPASRVRFYRLTAPPYDARPPAP